MNLKKPEIEWDEKDERWQELTETLFKNLRDTFTKNVALDFPALYRDLETWLPFYEEEQQERWNMAYRLLWCTEQASRYRQRDWNEIERLIWKQAETFELLKGHKEWAVDCVRLLLGHESFAWRLDLPVALSDELTSSQGVLATLCLEARPSFGGGAFHYPANALMTYPKPDFGEALECAWKAVNRMAQQHGTEGTFVGRWRLLSHSGHPVREVGGRSASGAAALGWYHLLRKTKPDDGIIVLAQIDNHGELSGVGGVPAKVKAIADGRFDTIVVASDKNQREAEEVLREKKMLDQIRVVNINAD